MCLLAIGQSTYAQSTYGGRVGTNRDTYIINQDNSNYIPALRLQDKDQSGILDFKNGNFRLSYVPNVNHSDYGPYNSSNEPIANPRIALNPSKGQIVAWEIWGGGAAVKGYCDNDQYGIFQNSYTNTADPTKYALLQDTNGRTILNSASGQKLHFRQGNIDKMWLDTNGNVTMGKNLTVKGTSLFEGVVDIKAGNGNGIRFWQSDYYKIHMGNTSAYKYGPVTDYAIKMNMRNTAGRGWVWGVHQQAPVAAISNTGAMKIKGDFETEGSLAANDKLTFTYDTQNRVGGKIYMYDGANTDYGIYLAFAGAGRALDGGTAVAGWRGASHNALRFRTYAHPRMGFIWENHNNELLMSLTGTGEAYIKGTLDVKGKLSTSEIEVLNTTTWPDYVFADDYTLPTLDSVESHIKANRHLPGVPSEAEVNEEGINLGEMDAVLLQKIEELTLYLIAQQKEIAQLKQQINVQQN